MSGGQGEYCGMAALTRRLRTYGLLAAAVVLVVAINRMTVAFAQTGNVSPQPLGVDALDHPPNVQWFGHKVSNRRLPLFRDASRIA